MKYRYYFDPSSKKYRCPRCGKKRFVRYIDKVNNQLAPANYGKCDRADNCNYLVYPKGGNANYTPIYRKEEEIIYNHFLSSTLIAPTLKRYDNNNFILFLQSKFDNSQVQNAIEKYKIGSAKRFEGATLFWLIDINNKTRTGKIMLFDSETGKRVRKPKAKITWVHNQLKWQNKLPNNYKLKQCLFGEHLLNQLENCNKTIAIVESEKTAIIMSIIYPKYVWLACGSKEGIKLSLLLPIKNIAIVLFPDKSCFEFWKNKALELNVFGFNIATSKLLEGLNLEKGGDLVDLLF